VSAFEAIAGLGIRGTVEGEVVLLGNRRLFRRENVDPAAAEAAMARLESEGKTAMLVGWNGALVGVIAVADTLKPEAKEAVAALRREKVEVIMLTGDNRRTAEAIGRELAIDRVIAEVLPGDKAKVIKELQSQGKMVAMVGDGVNDAPALATADIGIAIGSGSDVAKETGGIILIKDDVREVVLAIRLSRATLRKIKQNLFWAFAYNTALIPVAAGVLYPLFSSLGGVPSGLQFFFGDRGFLNPILAALAMAFSSVSVVSNSLRLRRFKVA
jgi:Cu+-exporting ATPase